MEQHTRAEAHRPPTPDLRATSRVATLALALILASLAGFALWSAHATNQASGRAGHASRLSDAYQQARYAVGAEESLERKYRLEPGGDIRTRHRAAGAALVAALDRVARDGDADDRALAAALLATHTGYLAAIDRMFRAVDAGDTTLVTAIDNDEVDPLFAAIEGRVDAAAAARHAAALAELDALARTERLVFALTPLVFAVGLALVGLLWGYLRRYRRRSDAAARHEAARLATLNATLAAQATQLRDHAAVLAAANAALRASEASLADAQALAHLGNWEVDLATGATRWSAEACRIFGLDPAAVAPSYATFLAAIHPDDRAAVDRAADEAAAALAPRSLEYRLVRPDGAVRVVQDQSHVLFDDADRPRRRLGAILDITERQALERQLAHQAFHDALTGLPNRALVLDRLGHALARGGRDGAATALLLLDLDGFKHVNDSLGHEAGDRLLVAFVARLPGCCLRPGDTLARLGGDEFVVLLEGLGDPDEAARLAARIVGCPALWAPYPLDGREVIVQASVGVAVGRAGETDASALLRDADTALYRAKEAGKGDYAVFDPAMNAAAVARLELEADLRRAVAGGELALAYQPLVALADGRIRRAEALVRWTHPSRGPVSPAVFIPLAEETGLIRDIGRWVLVMACRQAAAWRRDHGDRAPTVCVNLAAREFQDPDLPAAVARVLRDAGLDPAGLELEITEGVLMGDAPGTLATLWQLRELGVGLAVDDFGTGYSSLAYLKRFPVDTLKIDRAFVAGLGTDADDTAIVGAVVGLAHALGLAVVAEGVETIEQATGLIRLGCTLAQGYHFARPLPPAALAALLAAGPLPLPDAGPGERPAPPGTGALRQWRARRQRPDPLPGTSGPPHLVSQRP